MDVFISKIYTKNLTTIKQSLKLISMQLTKNETKIADIFTALGDKTRLKLYRILLNEKEICVSSMADVVGISPAGTSQHLKILEKTGLIKRNRYGQKVCYKINENNEIAHSINKIVKGKTNE